MDRVVVVAPDDHDLLVAVGHPRELGPEPGADRRVAHRARDVGVVELQVGPHVDQQRTRLALDVDLPRGERLDVDVVHPQRAAVQPDDRLEVRRLGPERRRRRLHELGLVVQAEQGVVVTLVGDRRRDLHVHPRPAAQRAAQVPGPHLARVGQREQRVAQGSEDALRPLLPVDREVRARDVADEQRVARQHRPRLGTAGGVDQREGGVLGPVARCVQRPHPDAAELELPPVLDGLVVVVGLRVAVDVDRGPRRGHQPAVAGDVVRVVVRLEHVLDRHAHVPGEREVLVDVELRIDDRGDARVLVADQVRRAPQVVVGDLAEDHDRLPPTRARSGRRAAPCRVARAATRPTCRAGAA
jgi:hypothetical protein